MPRVVVTGSLDDLRSRQVRFLQEAARLGDLHVLMWSDALTTALDGKPPRFPQAERLYILQAIRYVSRVTMTEDRATSGNARDLFPHIESLMPDVWAVCAAQATPAQRAFCAAQGISYHVSKIQNWPDLRKLIRSPDWRLRRRGPRCW